MKYPSLLVTAFLVFSFSLNAHSTSKPWTTVGDKIPGFAIFDILGEKIQVRDGDKDIELNSLLQDSGKNLAVVQVIEVTPSGSVCFGCVNKGNKIAQSIRNDKLLSPDTLFIMLVSDKNTPPDSLLDKVRGYAKYGAKVLGDINGNLQETFGPQNNSYPITLILDSEYRGKAINLHKEQPSKVVRILRELVNASRK